MLRSLSVLLLISGLGIGQGSTAQAASLGTFYVVAGDVSSIDCSTAESGVYTSPDGTSGNRPAGTLKTTFSGLAGDKVRLDSRCYLGTTGANIDVVIYGATIRKSLLHYNQPTDFTFAAGDTGMQLYSCGSLDCTTNPIGACITIILPGGSGAGCSSLSPGLTPTFDTPLSTSSGFTVNVTNYDANYAWNPSVSSGSVSSGSPASGVLPLTVTGLSAGTSATVTIATTRTGYTTRSATVTEHALAVAGPLNFTGADFGTVSVGSTGTSTVTVSNSGGAAAVPTAITAAGIGVGITGGTCAINAAIAPSASCTVQLSWTANSAGALTGASLTITYTGGPNPGDTVTLTGTAQVVATPGPLQFSGADFGTVSVGSTGTSTVTVTNSGGAAAIPTAITATGIGVGITGGTCAINAAIAPSASCTVQLSWTVNSEGTLTGASLTIIYTGGANPSDTVMLTGRTNLSPVSTPTPVRVVLRLSSTIGCDSTMTSGFSGDWLTLPSADACKPSGTNATSGARLLGWSTSPVFPVAMAQAQVDKHWGVIDQVFDGLRLIFIPEGQSVLATADNTLYAIWNQ